MTDHPYRPTLIPPPPAPRWLFWLPRWASRWRWVRKALGGHWEARGVYLDGFRWGRRGVEWMQCAECLGGHRLPPYRACEEHGPVRRWTAPDRSWIWSPRPPELSSDEE